MGICTSGHALEVPLLTLLLASTSGPSEFVEGLTGEECATLLNVDVDYLHSFGFDALAVPPSLLPAYVCTMFLELELAFFGCGWWGGRGWGGVGRWGGEELPLQLARGGAT